MASTAPSSAEGFLTSIKGLQVATPDEARVILHLNGGDKVDF